MNRNYIYKPKVGWNLSKQRGQALVFTLVVLGFITLSVILLISGSFILRSNAISSAQSSQAIALAEAGIDKAAASMNAQAGSYSGDSETVLGPGTYEVKITSQNPSTKLITSTGYIPNKAHALTSKTVQIQLSSGSGSDFKYAMQSGAGGVTMSDNDTINGTIYSNGNIGMPPNDTITGDAWVAGGTQPNSDQSSDCSPPNCSDLFFGKNVNGNNVLDVAQSFKPACPPSNPSCPAGTKVVINKVSLKVKKIGNPSDLTVSIMGDSSGSPNKNNVLVSGTLYASLVTTQYGFVDAVFQSVNLTVNTPYWIMIQTPSADPNNYWAWSEDTLQGYTNGAPKWSTNWQARSPVWNAVAADLGFETFMGGVATQITGTSNDTIGGEAHADYLANLKVTSGAYYQTMYGVSAGSLHPGASDPPTESFPISDGNIQEWENSAAALGVHNGDINGCTNGKLTLSAGEYNGSLQLYNTNNCTITVGTPVWITGLISLGNNDTFQLDSSYGAASGILIVNGIANILNNVKFNGSGTSGSYLMLISNHNSNGNGGDCAITFNGSGKEGIVYAPYGEVCMGTNNNLSEIDSWGIFLSNNVTITYDQGLASTFFSSGPGGGFSAIKGSYQLK